MAGTEQTIRLAEETISVSRQTVETGRVRVRVVPGEHDEAVDIAVTEQRLHVERVPVGRFLDAAPPIRTEGDTTIIPVLEERAVTTVRLFLREELRVRTETTTRTERRVIRLRSERATVERSDINQGATTDE